MNAIVPANFGAVSTRFAGTQVNDDLSSGVQSSFGLMGYKGKVWSIRYRGDETPLLRDDGDGARGSIEVIILKASSQISKIYYENGYVEGSNAAPDCFSNNGVVPEASSAKKQCASCAACPMNQWGSRITPQGKQGKACSDSKRLAIVPNGDIDNDLYGGPMLLRVPAASLQDVAMYGQKMQQMGYPYFAVATRIAFDPNEAFPKFVFNAIRPLSDEEAEKVIAIREGHQVNRILNESEFAAPAPVTQQSVASAFEQPPQAGSVQPQATPVNDVQVQPVETDAERELRELKAALAAKQANAAAAAQKAAEEQAAQEAAAQKAAADKAAREAAALRELEALKAAAAQVEAPVETAAERELRELKASMAAEAVTPAGNAGNVAASTVATPQPTEAAPAPAPATTATASPSDFEMNLDSMLENLLA